MVQVIREEEFWSKLENGIIVWFDYITTRMRFNLMHRSGAVIVRPMLDIAILNCSGNATELFKVIGI